MREQNKMTHHQDHIITTGHQLMRHDDDDDHFLSTHLFSCSLYFYGPTEEKKTEKRDRTKIEI